MIKFRIYYDKDKDEEFINKMAKNGYALKKFILGFYKFEKTKEKYTYRIDLIQGKTEREIIDYINLIEETGAEYVQRWGIWIIFRKKGAFDLYTDVDSQILHYTKIRNTFILFTLLELSILPSQISEFFLDRVTRPLFIVTTILLIMIIFIFIFQIYKTNKKVRKLRELE